MGSRPVDLSSDQMEFREVGPYDPADCIIFSYKTFSTENVFTEPSDPRTQACIEDAFG
jgi:hypothetical protein